MSMIEYEAKVLDIDPGRPARLILDKGGEDLRKALQRCYVYDIEPGDASRWVRLRDTGSQVTPRSRRSTPRPSGHPQGLPLVGDFETSYALLGKLGYASKAYQENRGHNFSLDGVQLEIEAGNRAEVVRVAALLGLWGSKPDGSAHDQDLRSLQHRPVRHRRSALRRGVSACCGAPDFYAKGCTAAWTC